MNYEDISRLLKAPGPCELRGLSDFWFEFEKSTDSDGEPIILVTQTNGEVKLKYEMSPNKFSELIKDAFDDYLRGYRYDNPNDEIRKIERN